MFTDFPLNVNNSLYDLLHHSLKPVKAVIRAVAKTSSVAKILETGLLAAEHDVSDAKDVWLFHTLSRFEATEKLREFAEKFFKLDGHFVDQQFIFECMLTEMLTQKNIRSFLDKSNPDEQVQADIDRINEQIGKQERDADESFSDPNNDNDDADDEGDVWSESSDDDDISETEESKVSWSDQDKPEDAEPDETDATLIIQDQPTERNPIVRTTSIKRVATITSDDDGQTIVADEADSKHDDLSASTRKRARKSVDE